MSIDHTTDTAGTALAALLERVELTEHGDGTVTTVARDGVVHAVITPANDAATGAVVTGSLAVCRVAAVFAASGAMLANGVTLADAQATAARYTLVAAADHRERVRTVELAAAHRPDDDGEFPCSGHATRCTCDEFVVAEGGVEVPAQRPASLADELAADPVRAARALAVALGVSVGPDLALPMFPTVWVVTGGTAPSSAPFVAVVTRDEHSAWVTAADLVGKGGARVDPMPLI